MSDLPAFATECATGLELRVKVVPGASRTRVVGLLGDRLKIQVAAPPEGGKANQAVIACLASWLGLPAKVIELVAGQSQPLKTLRLPAGTPIPDLH
jgi:uncharacterized protein (TIGR00251 family)